MSLDKLRRQIDRIDSRLLGLLNRRAELARRIGAVKKKHGLPIFDGKRERAVLERLLDSNAGPLPQGAVRRIFQEILSHNRRLQAGAKRG